MFAPRKSMFTCMRYIEREKKKEVSVLTIETPEIENHLFFFLAVKEP